MITPISRRFKHNPCRQLSSGAPGSLSIPARLPHAPGLSRAPLPPRGGHGLQSGHCPLPVAVCCLWVVGFAGDKAALVTLGGWVLPWQLAGIALAEPWVAGRGEQRVGRGMA